MLRTDSDTSRTSTKSYAHTTPTFCITVILRFTTSVPILRGTSPSSGTSKLAIFLRAAILD
jgi:hypothetical protein